MDSSPHHAPDNEELIRKAFVNFFIVMQMLILVLGIVGNSLIIYFFLSNAKLRTVRNAFMLNLTLANVLLLSICTPSFHLSLLFPSWTGGSMWCKFSHSIQIVLVLVCSFSIMMIAVDRWMCIVYSRSRQLTPKDVLLSIIIIWLMAIFLSMPTFFNRFTKELYDESLRSMLNNFAFNESFLPELASIGNIEIKSTINTNNNHNNNDVSHSSNNNNNKNNDSSLVGIVSETINSSPSFDMNSIASLKENMASHNLIYCVEEWPNRTLKRIYILILFIVEFVLPCIILLITYIWIIRFLKANDLKMSHYEMLRRRLIQSERPHQKNCKLLSALCITFIICYLPLSFFNIKAEFYNENVKADKEIYSPLTILTTLEVMNTLASPLLYGWMNHNFRVEIKGKITHMKLIYFN